MAGHIIKFNLLKKLSKLKLSNYYYNWGSLKNRVQHFWLKSRCALMTQSKMVTLVCRGSMLLGESLYVELFF